MTVWSGLKRRLWRKFSAAKSTAMKLLPNQNYESWIPKNDKAKRVLPKNPTVRQLRNFSHDPIVRKAITLIADTISTLPYTIDVIDGKRNKRTRAIKAIKNIVDHPNLVHNRNAFTKMLLDDAVVLDAMCAEVAKSVNDKEHPIYLYPVDGSTIQMVVPRNYTDTNAPAYMQYQQDGEHFFTAEQVAYLQRQYFTYSPYGFSPLMSCYHYIRYYLDTCDQTNRTTTNATADFAIGLGEGVSTEEKDMFIEYFNNEIEGTGKIPILSGSDFTTHQIRGAIMSDPYIRWIEKLTEIIAVAMGLPPEKLGVQMANDRSTGEDQENTTLQEAIKPYAAMIEDLYNDFVIKQLGFEGILKFRFIYEDSEQQKTIKSKRVVDEYYKGCITENEFRSLMGYEASVSKYADMTYPEKTAQINVDLGIAGGFNGLGDVKDTSGDTPSPTGDSSHYDDDT